MINRRNLSYQALEYIRSCLQQGRTLSATISSLDLAKGHIWTYLPSDVSDEAAQKLNQGGVNNVISPKSYLETIIYAYLKKDVNSCCIFENALALASDPYIQRLSTPRFFLGQEVYHFLTHNDADMKEIHNALSVAESYLLIGILTYIPSIIGKIQNGQYVSAHNLTELVAQAEMVIIGAYDGEGFVVWNR